MLRHGPGLAGTRDLCTALVVAEMMIDSRKAIVDRAPYRDLAVRSEQRMEIVLEIGEQKSADTGRLEQPHVPGLPAGKIDMRIESEARAPAHLIHVAAPDLALEAAMQW